MIDQAHAMTEEELLIAITDALTLFGWRWMHLRRSDLARVQGSQGWPDLIAIHPDRRLAMALELKTHTGRPTEDQAAWLAFLNLAGIPARIVRPMDLDLILEVITGKARPLGPGVPDVAPWPRARSAGACDCLEAELAAHSAAEHPEHVHSETCRR